MSATPQHPVLQSLPPAPATRSHSRIRQLLDTTTGWPSILAVLLIASSIAAFAQDTPEAIRQKIEKQYPVTKTTAAKDDIVNAGAVLVLEKDGLVMTTIASSSEARNTYKGGKLSPDLAWRTMSLCKFCPHTDKVSTMRTFVSGEKFWLTSVEMRDDRVVLHFFSDPISDVRYSSQLQFPYTHGAPVDPLMASIAEVVKVQPSDDSKAATASTTPAPAAPATPAPAPLAAIAPPPPPADAPPPEPKTVKIGQTKEQVVAMFGPPNKLLDKGVTKIYVYPDMKVTIKADKVVDIE
jgi:hypothetical protein